MGLGLVNQSEPSSVFGHKSTSTYLEPIFAFFSDGVHCEIRPGVADDGRVAGEQPVLVEHPQRRVDLLLGEVARRAEHHEDVGGVRVVLVVFDPHLLEEDGSGSDHIVNNQSQSRTCAYTKSY